MNRIGFYQERLSTYVIIIIDDMPYDEYKSAVLFAVVKEEALIKLLHGYIHSGSFSKNEPGELATTNFCPNL